MAVSINQLAQDLKDKLIWQRTPTDLSDEDYIRIIKRGIRNLYIDTQRASLYDTDLYVTSDQGELIFNADMPIDEQEYVLILCQIDFLSQVSKDVNNIVGYTTDALTVTNADKPYANISDSIAKLENERRIKYYKMVRYTLSDS